MSDVELKEAFALFDPTNSGTIQPQAFRDALNSLGNEEFARTVKLPSQPIDYNAFVKLIGPAFGRPDHSDHAFTVLFKTINKDGTGNISAAELKAAVRSFGNNTLTEADIDEIIHEADVSGDGRINYEEFLKIMQKSERKLRGETVL